MAPTVLQEASDADDIEVLVTGFGPFGRFSTNPSWLCTAPLHGVDIPLQAKVQKSSVNGDTYSAKRRKIRVQAIMTPVVYGHILDLVPRIHGNEPASPGAERWVDPRGPQPEDGSDDSAQGNGQPYPHGYRDLRLPVDAQGKQRPFDLVVHVGVGSPGHVALETIAHKRGYNKPDARGRLGPVIDSVPEKKTTGEMGAAERRELDNIGAPAQMNGTATADRQSFGFGEGYEKFLQEESMGSKAVAATVRWLQKECGFKHVRQSMDPGRYLCDFIFYCSLAEQERAHAPTFVQFIHVPPLGQPYGTEECTDIIRSAIGRLAEQVVEERRKV